MARKPRIFGTSGSYHIILRGNNQQNIFYNDKDRTFFINKMKKYSSELKIHTFAFCLMNNHVHILLGNANKTLSLFVQKLANSYVYYFNRKYERSGHLFQGRFKSEPVENDEYFKTVLRYIIQNPQKSKIARFNSYKWSSYPYFSINSDNFIHTNYIYSIFDNKLNTLNFISQTNNDFCMEFKNKLILPDSKALQLLKQLLHIKNPYNLIRFDLNTQMEKIRILKNNGLSINQISRLTGISRKITKLA